MQHHEWPGKIELNSTGATVTPEEVGVDALKSVHAFLTHREALRKSRGPTGRDLLDALHTQPVSSTPNHDPYPIIDLGPDQYSIR